MKTTAVVVVAGAAVLAASCVVRRPAQFEPRCVPLPVPLLVANGEVIISCACNPEELRGNPRPSLLDCTIHPKATDRPGKMGHFYLPERHDEYRFDPAQSGAYESWDGCYRIHLRDGRD